jgi:putative SOS response-associated peptidase YedK
MNDFDTDRRTSRCLDERLGVGRVKREVSLDPLRWGLIPNWCNDPKGGRKPINAKAETVASLPMFREAYGRRRSILPVDSFFEWKAIKGTKVSSLLR